MGFIIPSVHRRALFTHRRSARRLNYGLCSACLATEPTGGVWAFRWSGVTAEELLPIRGWGAPASAAAMKAHVLVQPGAFRATEFSVWRSVTLQLKDRRGTAVKHPGTFRSIRPD